LVGRADVGRVGRAGHPPCCPQAHDQRLTGIGTRLAALLLDNFLLFELGRRGLLPFSGGRPACGRHPDKASRIVID